MQLFVVITTTKCQPPAESVVVASPEIGPNSKVRSEEARNKELTEIIIPAPMCGHEGANDILNNHRCVLSISEATMAVCPTKSYSKEHNFPGKRKQRDCTVSRNWCRSRRCDKRTTLIGMQGMSSLMVLASTYVGA